MKIKRILAPVDFSRSSLKALDHLLAMFELGASEVVVIHVIEPVTYALPRFLPEPTELLEEQRKVAAKQIERIEQRLRKKKINCRSEIHFGVVYETIIEVAKRLKADLIVVSTHGRSSLAHVMLGSVAERVVRGAPCPVLSVRTEPLATGGRRRSPRRRRPAKRAEPSS